MGEDIEFDFGFCAAGSDGVAEAVFEGDEVEVLVRDLLAIEVHDSVFAEVNKFGDFKIADFFWWVIAVAFKDVVNFLDTCSAFVVDV